MAPSPSILPLTPNGQADPRPVPRIHTPLPGPRARAFLERDQKYVSPSYTRAYPLVVERGHGCVIEDVDGNLFLDFTAGIAVTATGHCHPDVVAAIQDQAAKLIHMSGTDFYYQPQIDLAEKLAEVAPGPPPKRVFFTNSGAEALEAALKLARWHTGRSRAIAFFGAFHGRTYGAMSLSGSKLVHRRGFSPLVPDIHHVPYPARLPRCAAMRVRTIRCRRCVCVRRSRRRSSSASRRRTRWRPSSSSRSRARAAITCRRRASCQRLRQLCDRHGILLVADEVQSRHGPDRQMFAGRALGRRAGHLCAWPRGLPAGCRWGRSSPARTSWTGRRGSHASTFGGNPVSCRAALATMDLLEGGIHRQRGGTGRAAAARFTANAESITPNWPMSGVWG